MVVAYISGTEEEARTGEIWPHRGARLHGKHDKVFGDTFERLKKWD